jgi:Sulfotransferase family
VAGALPNLVLIGAPKCGTTSLHYYLSLHPETSMSSPKELGFFIDELEVEGLSEDSVRLTDLVPRNWHRGEAWYAGHFDAAAKVRGESTPNYVAPWYPGVADRMADLIPDAKLLMCIRDPVERAISHHVMTFGGARDHRPIEEAFADRSSQYWQYGRYTDLLAPFLERFDRSQLMVIDHEALLRRRRETVAAVFRFAGIDDSFWSPRIARELNPSTQSSSRKRLWFRLRHTPVMRVASKLPGDVKWLAERFVVARSSESRPALSPELRAEMEEELVPGYEALRRESGEALAGRTV